MTDEQLTVVDLVAKACASKPYPSHITEDSSYSASTSEPAAADTYVGTLEDAVLQNTNQFYKWHSELEAACASETEEKYKQYADLLNSHLKACGDISGKVDETLEYFDTLLSLHKEVSQKSKALSSSCEQLAREKDHLVAFADVLRSKLKFFDEFETVFAQFQTVQNSLDSDQFLQLLKRLDDCIAYVTSNQQYADAAKYATKFRQLQGRALSLVHNKVQQVLKHAVQQVQQAVEASVGPVGKGAHANLAEGTEMSLLYVRFRAAAEPSLKGLLREIESRSQRGEYTRLLGELQALYCAARRQLVTPFVQQRIDAHRSEDLPLLLRKGCEQLVRVCNLEAQLFEQFFPGSRAVASSTGGAASGPRSLAGTGSAPGPNPSSAEVLVPLLEPLVTTLYDVLRPILVQLQDIDELCELVDILKHEVLGEQMGRRSGAAEALRPILARVLADVQQRLIFRCQAFVRDEVAGYVPTAADVDFPAKLERAAALQASADGQEGEDGTSTAGVAENGHAAGEANGASQQDPYSTWYLPLRDTLLVLSKLYRAVDSRIFSGLAQEAVAACTASVASASRQVARKAGALDAHLFMIKHLLFLREQIAPFDVDFCVTDTDLDFSHMRNHLRAIMAGELSLFTLTSSNAVVQMLGKGGPRVMQTQLDSKRELERQLKLACEAFIMQVTKMAVEPMLSFITKVTAVRVAGAANPALSRPLREQAFAAPAKLAEMVERVNAALQGALPEAAGKLRLYLPNPNTRGILFKPIKSNIAEAHSQIAALLSRDYSPEEAAEVRLMPPQQLGALLDGMC